MSKIQAALVAIAASLARGGFDPEKYKDRAEMRTALVKAANDMDDKQWAGLSVAAQDWFNDAADAVKAKKDTAEFPDYEPPAAEPETRSRRRTAEQDDPAARDDGPSVDKLEEGQRVKIVTKRGKTYEGEVVENNKKKEFVALKDADGQEDEIDYDKVAELEVFHGTADAGGGDAAAGPEVGDEVTFTTKRGKKISGVIQELTDEVIVVDSDDYDLDRIDGDITIVKKGKAPTRQAEPEPETRGRRNTASDDKGGDDKGDGGKGDDKPKRSSNPKGVSVGGRIRELMAEDPDRTEESVGKVLDKEGIEYRPATLSMIYKDCALLIKALRDEGHMKKAK